MSEHKLCDCGHASYETATRCFARGRSLVGWPLRPGDAKRVKAAKRGWMRRRGELNGPAVPSEVR